MKKLLAFFEIPALDFNRAIDFYQTLLNIELSIMECKNEKMAFFPEEEGKCIGAIFCSEGYKPSGEGVIISLNVESMEQAQKVIEEKGGKVVLPKTKIEAENRGYFSLFIDSEGNRLGLYSEN